MHAPGGQRDSRRSSTSSDSDDDIAAGMVFDGFRPNTASRLSTHRRPAPPPPVAATSPTTKNVPPPRPSDATKPPRPHDSLTIRHDGAAAPRSGPSHPYHMYPQRTMSNATESISISRATRQSLDITQHPSHPYSLYTQDTSQASQPTQQTIPVGFSDRQTAYQRQLGPDGEESGDLVGPMGHTEELPPYTRYPEFAVAAKPPAATSGPEPRPQSPAESIAGAGGLGIATRNPEYSSTQDTLAVVDARPSTASSRQSGTGVSDFTEKPTVNKWQRRGKKKLWGIIPYWAICLVLFGMLIMGIVMGSVIGTVLSRHPSDKKTSDSDSDTEPANTTSPGDVVPFHAVPTGIPPLATGPFWIPPLSVDQSPSSCVSLSAQSKSWSCDVPAFIYAMKVELVPGMAPTNRFGFSMKPFDEGEARLRWGVQLPEIHTPISLLLVNDTFERNRPAWFGKIVYNKTVLISEASIKDSVQKRGSPIFDDSGISSQHEPANFQEQPQGAQAGDRVWKCIWPDTKLFISIYPHHYDSSLKMATRTTSATSSTTSSTVTSPPPQLHPYPSKMKLVERRSHDLQDTVTCQKFQVNSEKTYLDPMHHSDGTPIQITVSERTGDLQNYSTYPLHDALDARGDLPLSGCSCLWYSN